MRIYQIRRWLCLAIVGFAGACTHPLEIVGDGDIISSDGTRDCALEAQPCDIVVTEAYLETYSAQPRPGFEFVAWEGCASNTSECHFDVPEEIVAQFFGFRVAPLIAKFAPLCSNAPVSSFASIQQEIFSGKGCSAGGCHNGSRGAAGLTLAAGQSYDAIVDMRSSQGPLNLVEPGDAEASYLYRKVAARTNPGSFPISGQGMPLSSSALTEDELEALAAWINAGAPQSGRADELKRVEVLLGLCN